MSDTTPEWIFAKDMEGLGPANAVLALLDGPMVDDGTACEIGIFYALMQSDPSKKGVVGLLTDLRGSRGESSGLNLFVEGLHRATGGEVVGSFDDALAALRRLRGCRAGSLGASLRWNPSATRRRGAERFRGCRPFGREHDAAHVSHQAEMSRL